MEAKAGQRREYLKQIKNIYKEELVYIDEKGIDCTNYKDCGWVRKARLYQVKLVASALFLLILLQPNAARRSSANDFSRGL